MRRSYGPSKVSSISCFDIEWIFGFGRRRVGILKVTFVSIPKSLHRFTGF